MHPVQKNIVRVLYMETFYVFGDSHSMCFNGVCKKVHSFCAASAKGLSNVNSISRTHEKISSELISISNVEKNTPNILFFFGKVDMDFTLNYKYNTDPQIDFDEYIVNIAKLYIKYIKGVCENKNIFICELPIPHMNDHNLLARINNENSMRNINTYLSGSDNFSVMHMNKVFGHEKRIDQYILFNNELRKLCDSNGFKLLEINKYFVHDNKGYDIPLKYVNINDKLDHHLNSIISELFVKDYRAKYHIRDS